MRISDWSSDVCSSDLGQQALGPAGSESMAMAPRNSAPSSQAAKGGTAASSVAAAWNSGRLAGVMAVLLGSGVQLGGGTSQRLRPGGASVGMKGMKEIGRASGRERGGK